MTTAPPLAPHLEGRAAAAAADAPVEAIGLRRMRGPGTTIALVLVFIAAVGEAMGAVVAGRLAAGATGTLVALLALCVVGGALLDAIGWAIWSTFAVRAEGRLRDDLLTATWSQPVQALSEQAAGEILDRIDGDTHELGSLVRVQLWSALRVVFIAVPMWIVGGVTWRPAFVLFPVVAVVVWLATRRLFAGIARRKVLEEAAWTDQTAHLEEAVAARDDLRTSLGAPFALRRSVELSARVFERLMHVLGAQSRLLLVGGGLLQGLLAAVAVTGVALVLDDRLSVSALVTLFLVTATFVAQFAELTEELPELQAGMGAVIRLRMLLDAEREPRGGTDLPDGGLDIRIDGPSFTFGGPFTLRVPHLEVPAGETLALVGRSGSGKSTLAALLSRAVEPPVGTVRLGGVDVCEVDPNRLRRAVGVVTQRTEIVAGTVAENVALFADLPRARIVAALDELGLTAWIGGLPQGIDTPLGAGGTVLSAGEEQLIAFARLLVRDVRLVILDEATARMDPTTERLVVQASARLLVGRTGVVIAHRLATTRRADRVAVLREGRIVQEGPRAVLAETDGPYRALLEHAGEDRFDDADAIDPASVESLALQAARRLDDSMDRPAEQAGDRTPSLARVVLRAAFTRPSRGVLGGVLFLLMVVTGAQGVLTAYAWGTVVQRLADGADLTELGPPLLGVVVALTLGVVTLPIAFYRYFGWWNEVLLRVRTSLLVAQTAQRRVAARAPGEIVARALDAERLVLYVDRWVDLLNGAIVVVLAAFLADSLLAGAVLAAVLIVAAVTAWFARPTMGAAATAAADARAVFGRVLVSALDASRTVKLSAASDAVRAHLRRVDTARVAAAIREQRVSIALYGILLVTVQLAVVATWLVHLAGGWDLATTLMLSLTVSGFTYFGLVTGWVISEAPGTRAWQRETSELAGGADLVRLPDGVDLWRGTAPAPQPAAAADPGTLELRDVSVVHGDGTVGVEQISATIRPGELVLLVGRVGSGKSSLLRALAGLLDHTGEIRWNGSVVDRPDQLRPERIAWVGQTPRVLSGTWTDNIVLDHPERDPVEAAAAAQLGPDLAAAGGLDSRVGQRGVRLSGGQVQRLALARALATGSRVILADDVSSALDATTELELWSDLRKRGVTVIGATSKRAALALADRVIVLDRGRVADTGRWRDLDDRWGHLAG